MPDYITLRQAEQSSGVSRDVLRQAALRNLLQADKVGRDWLTTEEWLADYLRGYVPRKGTPDG